MRDGNTNGSPAFGNSLLELDGHLFNREVYSTCWGQRVISPTGAKKRIGIWNKFW
jgi:hypothetical protein